MRNQAQRDADSRCSPTCPAVDKAFDALRDDIYRISGLDVSSDIDRALDQCSETVKNKGTMLLRDELVSACDELNQLRDELKDIERERDRLLDEVTDLREAVANA